MSFGSDPRRTPARHRPRRLPDGRIFEAPPATPIGDILRVAEAHAGARRARSGGGGRRRPAARADDAAGVGCRRGGGDAERHGRVAHLSALADAGAGHRRRRSSSPTRRSSSSTRRRRWARTTAASAAARRSAPTTSTRSPRACAPSSPPTCRSTRPRCRWRRPWRSSRRAEKPTRRACWRIASRTASCCTSCADGRTTSRATCCRPPGACAGSRCIRWAPASCCSTRTPAKPGELARFEAYPKLFEAFAQAGAWLDTLGIRGTGALNDAITQGRLPEVSLVGEALHEAHISRIAADIVARGEAVRVVLVAGPSSSGKTTFSKRLAVQLLASGRRPVPRGARRLLPGPRPHAV